MPARVEYLGNGIWRGDPNKFKPKTPVSAKSKAYIEARNKLIPSALEFANQKEGKRCPAGINHEIWGLLWNLAYHGKMNELAKDL